MENRHYKQMRDKETLEGAKRALKRTNDMQTKHIEILSATEKKLTALVVSTSISYSWDNDLT